MDKHDEWFNMNENHKLTNEEIQDALEDSVLLTKYGYFAYLLKTRNLTDEEADIYNSWLEAESKETGEKLF